MSFKKNCLLICLLLPISALAEYIVEPSLGVLSGTYKAKHSQSEYSYTTVEFGSKFGYSVIGIEFGLDAKLSFPEFEKTKPVEVSPPKTNFTSLKLGPYIGYTFPFLLKVWGSYYLGTDYEARGGELRGTLSANGYSLGGGMQLSFIPKVDVFGNFEFRSLDVYEVKSRTGIYDTNNTITEYIFSVSMPFEF